jgi:hypothetical protein
MLVSFEFGIPEAGEGEESTLIISGKMKFGIGSI